MYVKVGTLVKGSGVLLILGLYVRTYARQAVFRYPQIDVLRCVACLQIEEEQLHPKQVAMEDWGGQVRCTPHLSPALLPKIRLPSNT